ncbi:hypothetical protein [Plantactinospora sp. B5E13]|uniref:hypothetical protein n=1 Tax=unclassified Plantactinospora TaxID=2631981 RepID=UPI00325DC9A1
MTVSEAATTDVPTDVEGDLATGVEGAAWAAERVCGELREAYLTVAAAAVLLGRAGDGSMHPELRLARRCGEEALDLASHVEQLLGSGLARLRDQIGGGDVTSIGRVVASLDESRTQFAEAAERLAGLPGRLRAAERQLRDDEDPRLRIVGVTEDWSQAADHLGLLTDNLTEAVAALATYADRITGATTT